MGNINNLIMYQESRELIRLVRPITDREHFGDLSNQIRRAVVSVASNICEGAGSGSDRQFARYCNIARASANEALGQLQILADLGVITPDHPSMGLCDRIGRRLSCLIKRLQGP
jgi:four helix bundle protein